MLIIGRSRGADVIREIPMIPLGPWPPDPEVMML